MLQGHKEKPCFFILKPLDFIIQNLFHNFLFFIF